MIKEHELRAVRMARVWAYDDISGVWIAMDPTPTEYLGTEKFDHGFHDRFDATLKRGRGRCTVEDASG